MSLINQMLQDLDKRRAVDAGSNSPDAIAASDIRAVAPQKRGYPVVWQAAVFVLLAVAGILSWLLLHPPALPDKPAPPLAVQDTSVPALKTDAQLGHAEQAAASAPQVLPMSQPVAPVPAASGAALPPEKPATVEKNNALEKNSVAEKSAMPEQVAQRPVTEKAAAEKMAVPPKAEHVAVEKQVKELSPQQRAENEYRKAIGLVQNGRLTEAMESLQQAVKLDPYHLSARQTLAALLVEGKRAGEAEQTLQEGLKFSPEQSNFSMVLARLQAGRGDMAAALDTLRKGLGYARDKADYHALYAALLQRQEKHAEAVEQYQAALRIAPNSGVWLMGLGISLQAEQRNKEAAEAFTRAQAAAGLTPELKAFIEQRLKQLQASN